MLFEIKTTELMTKYGEKLITGTITPDELENLHQEEYRTPHVHQMYTMLDLVAASAPQMTPEILYKLTRQLFEADLKRDVGKHVFMREPTIAKYYLAYLACFYPENSKDFLSDEIISKAVIKPIDGERLSSDDVIILKFKNIILESAKFSLLLHMAKDKAKPLNDVKINDKIEMLSTRSMDAYKALNKSPTNVELLHTLQNQLILLIRELNEYVFRPIAEESTSEKPPSMETTRRRSLLSFFSLGRSNSASVNQQDTREAKSKISSRKRPDSVVSGSQVEDRSMSQQLSCPDSAMSSQLDGVRSTQSLSHSDSRPSSVILTQPSGILTHGSSVPSLFRLFSRGRPSAIAAAASLPEVGMTDDAKDIKTTVV